MSKKILVKGFLSLIKLLSLVITIYPLSVLAIEPESYPSIREQLIYYKEDNMKIYYGGPIENTAKGVKWLMPAVFTDRTNKVRAVYEISFINCNPEDAENAALYSIKASDINIKLQNKLNQSYSLFSTLINGNYDKSKYIVIRYVDVSMVTYPDIVIDFMYTNSYPEDLNQIAKFLSRKYNTTDLIQHVNSEQNNPIVRSEDKNYIIYEPERVMVDVAEESHFFYVTRLINKKDTWKIYYIISRNRIDEVLIKNKVVVRIDSGCVSGQIYEDDACDCLDQLQHALKIIASGGNEHDIIIHVPTHDGRGFGTAPKAETEIYKQGGKGMINITTPLDTIDAAKLLYQVNDQSYDNRSYDGVGSILQRFRYKDVILLTDNKLKVQSLQKHGIMVSRRTTNTNKDQCRQHLIAKRNEGQYYAE